MVTVDFWEAAGLWLKGSTQWLGSDVGGHLSPYPGWVPSFMASTGVLRFVYRATYWCCVSPARGNASQHGVGSPDYQAHQRQEDNRPEERPCHYLRDQVEIQRALAHSIAVKVTRAYWRRFRGSRGQSDHIKKGPHKGKNRSNSLLVAGHYLESVVGSLPDTCTISAGLVNPWSAAGQPLERSW